MNWVKKHYQACLGAVIGGLVVSFCVGALLQSGFPANHDRNLYMNWLYEFDLGIREGNLQPRWAPDVWIGYGAPLFNFIQPGFYYLAEAFHLLGFSLLIAVKAVIILSVTLGFVAMYFWSRSLWKNSWAALASATLYIWSPYHLGSLYLRGSYAELLAMGLWPLLLIALTRYLSSPARKYFIAIAVVTGALLLTNNALAVMFLPIAVGYTGVLAWRHWRKIFTAWLALLLGGGLGAFFWLPAVVEMRQANFSLYFNGTLDYANNFLNLKQLFVGDWSEYIFLIGLTGLVVMAAALYTVVEKPETRKSYGAAIWWWLAVFIIAVFMTSHASKIIWDHVGLLRDFQFPWRWLALASLSVGILSGLLIVYKRSVHRFSAPAVLASVLIGATLILNSSYAFPEDILPPLSDENYRPFRERETEIRELLKTNRLNEQVYFFSEIPNIFSKTVSVEKLQARMSETLAQYKSAALAQSDATIKIPEKFEIVSGQAKIVNSEIKSDRYTALIEADSNSILQVNTLWFPGWQIAVDGRRREPAIMNDLGVMEVSLSAGRHNVEVKLGLTPVQSVGRFLSGLSAAVLLLLAIFWKRMNSLVKRRPGLPGLGNILDK